MDEKLIQEIVSFLSKWYIWELVIIVLAILLTLAVKIPIKNAAIKWQEKYGIDKSKITWINGIFPYVFVFIMVFILYWYKSGWNMELKDPEFWKSVGTRTGILGSGAIGLYELIKKVKSAIIATMQKRELDKANKSAIVEVPVHGSEVVETVPAVVKKGKKADEVKKAAEVQPVEEKPTRH